MQHSKKKKAAQKGETVEANFSSASDPTPVAPSQGITGDAKVSSNLRTRSRLYWLFSCCGSTINVSNTPPDLDHSEKSE